MTHDENGQAREVGDDIRRLLRQCPTAALGTLEDPQIGQGDTSQASTSLYPYCSLVLVAVDHQGNPLMFLSDLADHTKNLRNRPQASLLFDGTVGRKDRLSGVRATVQGPLEQVDDPTLKARFVALHPNAQIYADFKDFNLYRMTVERGHLVAGFGRIHWVMAEDILLHQVDSAPLSHAEVEILAHMKEDHSDAVELIAAHARNLDRFQVANGQGWALSGVDPEGADLTKDGARLRVPFQKLATDAETCRVELVRLTKQARRAQNS
ncbi:MAG: DUF2470 domain-containing protein [Pseudomonadota bacterium]